MAKSLLMMHVTWCEFQNKIQNQTAADRITYARITDCTCTAQFKVSHLNGNSMLKYGNVDIVSVLLAF